MSQNTAQVGLPGVRLSTNGSEGEVHGLLKVLLPVVAVSEFAIKKKIKLQMKI